MRRVSIDPDARIARAEAGAVWLDVVESAAVAESVAAARTAMRPWAARQMYLNLADTSRDPASFWTPRLTTGSAASRPRSTRTT
jgi:hypothetical protein